MRGSGNLAYLNTGNGFTVGLRSLVQDNVAISSTGAGFSLGILSLVSGNLSKTNNLGAGDAITCTDCLLVDNHGS